MVLSFPADWNGAWDSFDWDSESVGGGFDKKKGPVQRVRDPLFAISIILWFSKSLKYQYW